MLYGGSVYGGIPGICPEVTQDWDGKTAIDEWGLDPKYVEKVQKKMADDKEHGYKPYTFLNAWIYFPVESKDKAAVCHYSLNGKGGNKLSLIIPGKNTDNSHFIPNALTNPGGNGQGIHCKAKTREECEFKDGPTERPAKPVKSAKQKK
jgi:hypothetical protein